MTISPTTLQYFSIVNNRCKMCCSIQGSAERVLAERLLADIFLKELTLPKLKRTKKRLDRGVGQYPKRLLNILVNSTNNR